MRTIVLGTTTVLADTGALTSASSPREASLTTGGVPSLLRAEALHSSTIGWDDQVDSEASLGSLGLMIGGTRILADFVMATASSSSSGADTGRSIIENLSINGIPIGVTGAPNQTIAIPGGRVVLNQQTISSSGVTVNALRATVVGVADVVIASATAGVP